MNGPSNARLLPDRADAIAPDGSEVRILAACARGSMAHFSLAPGAISKAVCHRTVDEVWFVTEGQGRMWLSGPQGEGIMDLRAGLSLAIPVGTRFQFRCEGAVRLCAVGVTMPPWPGMEEAFEVEGPWKPAT